MNSANRRPPEGLSAMEFAPRPISDHTVTYYRNLPLIYEENVWSNVYKSDSLIIYQALDIA